MVSDHALIAIGTYYSDISEMVRAEMIRTAENNPHASREDYIADIARHLANQVEPEMPDHERHLDCADACGLAVTHQGACLDRPGGRVVCDASNHVDDEEEYDHSRAKEDARNATTEEEEAALLAYLDTPDGRRIAKQLSAASHNTEQDEYERRILQVMVENADQPGFDRASAVAAIESERDTVYYAVEAMTFGNDNTDAEGWDCSGWMLVSHDSSDPEDNARNRVLAIGFDKASLEQERDRLTEEAQQPAAPRRFRLRDKDLDIWHPVEGESDTWVHSPGGAPTYMTRAQIERIYGPVREEDIT